MQLNKVHFVKAPVPGDSLSPVAPFRVVNIGNGSSVKLMDYIAAIEAACGCEAEKVFLNAQPGDVSATWADVSLLEALTGSRPTTEVHAGLQHFVDWYRGYYNA